MRDNITEVFDDISDEFNCSFTLVDSNLINLNHSVLTGKVEFDKLLSIGDLKIFYDLILDPVFIRLDDAYGIKISDKVYSYKDVGGKWVLIQIDKNYKGLVYKNAFFFIDKITNNRSIIYISFVNKYLDEFNY